MQVQINPVIFRSWYLCYATLAFKIRIRLEDDLLPPTRKSLPSLPKPEKMPNYESCSEYPWGHSNCWIIQRHRGCLKKKLIREGLKNVWFFSETPCSSPFLPGGHLVRLDFFLRIFRLKKQQHLVSLTCNGYVGARVSLLALFMRWWTCWRWRPWWWRR